MSQPSIKIKLIDGPTNSEDIYRLQALCLPDDTPASVDVGEWWLAYDDDEPVGFACLCKSKSLFNYGYLARAGVLPAYRGQGIQKRLIRVRLRRAAAHGWDGIVTDTRDNPASANALIGCGFRAYTPAHPYGYENTAYWRCKLLPAPIHP